MHNAVGIQKDQLTLSRGIWVSSHGMQQLSWVLNSEMGSPGEEAGEHTGQREK